MSSPKHRGLGALALSGVLVVSLLAGCRKAPPPLEFTVTFKNAKSVAPGQFLVYNGVRIGEVREVKLGDTGRVHVRILVDPEHERRVYREAEFVVEKPAGWTDLSGEKQLTMNDRNAGTKTPMGPGDIVVGTDGMWDRASNKAEEIGHWAKKSTSELLAKAEGWMDSPEGQAFQAQLRDFGGVAQDLGKSQWTKLRDEHYPSLKEKATALKRKLEETGRSEEAQRMWQQFEEFSRQLPGQPQTEVEQK
jgi:ABC-type transporter Mla subunit MlaD